MSPFADLSGRGGVLASGRWHNAGSPVVYMADSPSGAMLETIVHLEVDPEDLPENFQLLSIDVPDDASLTVVDDLPGSWRDNVELSRQIGNEWLASGETLLLDVPSAIMPHTHNYLMNPQHPEAKSVTFKAELHDFDQRLLGCELKP